MEVGIATCDTSRQELDTSKFVHDPDLVIYFGNGDFLAHGVAQINKFAPEAVVLGCTSGGQIQNDTSIESQFSAASIKFSSTRVKAAKCEIRDSQSSKAAGQEIGSQLAAEDLACVIIISDGLATNGSELASGISAELGPNTVVVGGLAGDGDRFEKTLVGFGDDLQTNMVVAVGLYGKDLNVSHGSRGGWQTFGPKRLVTRSQDNILYELDGHPVLDLYEKYLGDDAAGLPSTALLFPIQIVDPDVPGSEVVRTILNIDREKKSLIFAGNIPHGWVAQFMNASHHNLIEGATMAAKDAARERSDGELAILISCIGRKLVMNQRAEEEVEVVSDILNGIPQIGFYSYGELCPSEKGGTTRLHNQTMTITVLSEKV